jgi:xanthine/uracil permease
MALSVNDLGSIQSMNELLKPPDMSRRVTRGMIVTGLANMVSGFLGVIGPVNYSLSPGVISSTGCASRFVLLPAAFLLLLLSFSPAVIGFIGNVPPVVIGSVLIYIMCAQIAAGLMVVFESGKAFQFNSGLIIALPLLLGTIIAFLPVEIMNTFPTVLRPILGNGFVVGVFTALVLEHVIFRKVSCLTPSSTAGI